MLVIYIFSDTPEAELMNISFRYLVIFFYYCSGWINNCASLFIVLRFQSRASIVEGSNVTSILGHGSFKSSQRPLSWPRETYPGMIQGYNRNRFIVKEKYGFLKMLTQENLARGFVQLRVRRLWFATEIV